MIIKNMETITIRKDSLAPISYRNEYTNEEGSIEEAIERVSGSRLEGMTLKRSDDTRVLPRTFRLDDEHRKLNISRGTYTYAYTRRCVCYMLNGMGSSAYIPACLSKISWNRSTYCIIIDILFKDEDGQLRPGNPEQRLGTYPS